MDKCDLCELKGFCLIVKNDPDEYCEAFRCAIREQGGLNNLLTKIYESLNEAINNPIMNEKISLPPFRPEILEKDIEFFGRRMKNERSFCKTRFDNI